jgi:uncharacterized protein YxeA
MQRVLSFLLAIALAMTLSLVAFAQDDKEAKTALYNKFTEAYNRAKEIKKADTDLTRPGNKEAYEGAAKEAYDFAKEYIQKYPADDDAIARFQKKYVGDYEAAAKLTRKVKLKELIEAKKFDESFALGQQILADEPDDLITLYMLSRAGLFSAHSGNEAHSAATANYARKAIQLMQAGAVLPNESKDESLGVLHFALGLTTIRTSPRDAINAFKQVATLTNTAKNDPLTFYLLGAAYEAAEYDKASADYKTQCATPEQVASPSCKALSDVLNATVDRIIDAYARAVSLSGTNAKFATQKAEWLKQLTLYYKYRHEDKEDGLNELIAGITSKPLP